jgi:hypothetical protein
MVCGVDDEADIDVGDVDVDDDAVDEEDEEGG